MNALEMNLTSVGTILDRDHHFTNQETTLPAGNYSTGRLASAIAGPPLNRFVSNVSIFNRSLA